MYCMFHLTYIATRMNALKNAESSASCIIKLMIECSLINGLCLVLTYLFCLLYMYNVLYVPSCFRLLVLALFLAFDNLFNSLTRA